MICVQLALLCHTRLFPMLWSNCTYFVAAQLSVLTQIAYCVPAGFPSLGKLTLMLHVVAALNVGADATCAIVYSELTGPVELVTPLPFFVWIDTLYCTFALVLISCVQLLLLCQTIVLPRLLSACTYTVVNQFVVLTHNAYVVVLGLPSYGIVTLIL
jgi:hypothetical protein